MAFTAAEIYTALSGLITWAQTHNLWIGEAIRQGMFIGLAFGLINWTEYQQHVVLQALSALVTAYAAKANIAKQNVDAIVGKKVAERTGTGDGTSTGGGV